MGYMKNLATTILLNQLKAVHGALEGTMEGVTDDVAQFMPDGTANPIAGVYAHLVFSEDMFMNDVLRKTPNLMNGKFKDKTGASELHPMEWQTAYPKWLKEVKIDVKQFRAYSAAVFAESEKYVESLTDEELEKEVDMTAFGMGKSTVGDFIAGFISGHAYSIMGEIAVLKGVQGLKGYPF